MLSLHPATERGQADHGWLDSNFSFSLAGYYDPKQMGLRALRVLIEDHVARSRGFGKHPHQDMEILTYVLEGAVQREDSLGPNEVLVPGELPHTSAGDRRQALRDESELNRDAAPAADLAGPEQDGGSSRFMNRNTSTCRLSRTGCTCWRPGWAG